MMIILQCVLYAIKSDMNVNYSGGSPCVIIVKEIDIGFEVSEIELHLRHCVHVRRNTLGKGMKPVV